MSVLVVFTVPVLNSSCCNNILPVPLALSSKFELEFVVVITLSNICMSVLLSKTDNDTVSSMVILPAFSVPADKFCSTINSENVTTPTPLAANNKFPLVDLKLF